MESFVNKKTIAKNTIFLYLRMILTLIVSLYTSRIVLKSLGISDYGIYNVVGGLVAMFSFFNTAMSTSTSRFISYSLGTRDFDSVNKVFGTSVVIQYIIAILLALVVETIGLYYLFNIMKIAPNRINAAFWVLQFSMVSTVLMIISVPYNSLIISKENMKAFAYLSLIDVLLKLFLAYLITFTYKDKLITYACLLMIIQFVIRFIYMKYCKIYYKEIQYKLNYDKKIFFSIATFAGWSMYGYFAMMLSNQGLNLLLNSFFGTVTNAARGVAVQIQGTIIQLSQNLQVAINPQIVKTYADSKHDETFKLVRLSSRFSFFLLFLVSFPLICNIDFLLDLWLVDVPINTSSFSVLILLTALINAMGNSMGVAVEAANKLKKYNVIVSSLLLLNFPISYIALKYFSGDSSIVFSISLYIEFLCFITKLFMLKKILNFPLKEYYLEVLLRVFVVAIIPGLSYFVYFSKVSTHNTIGFIINFMFGFFLVTISIFLFGLTKNEKLFLSNKIKVLKQRFR
jgi:O-antigen/teichoic acid export membrane protein